MSQPFFSVIIPTYNRAFILEETLRHILEQDFRDLEIVIIDDGSQDNTRKVVESMMNKDGRIRYWYKENGERGAARNYGMQQACGRYCVFFDSDDIMLQGHLTQLHHTIQELGGQVNFIATKHNYSVREGEVRDHPGNQDLPEGWHDYATFLDGNHLACHFTVRRENPGLIPFEEDRDYAILEDWMFLMENLRHDRLFLIDRTTISMRKHDEQSMGNHETIIRRRMKANDYLLNRLNLSVREASFMTAHSYYFCAIHAYLLPDRGLALRLLHKAIGQIGMTRKFAVLYLKILIGKSRIDRLRP